MKFETIKVGETVYIRETVRVGWSGSESFWVPRKVERVTHKQFVVGGNRYKKEDGRLITSEYGGSPASDLGDIVFGATVVNQVREKNALIRNLSIASDSRDIIDKFKVCYDHPKLNVIYAKLKEIESLLAETKED